LVVPSVALMVGLMAGKKVERMVEKMVVPSVALMVGLMAGKKVGKLVEWWVDMKAANWVEQ